jgi:DNA polymerase III gamma/tau subunit
LEVVDRSLAQGQTLDYWCSLLMGQIRDLMLIRTCGPDTDLVDVPAGLRDALVTQAKRFDPGAFVYMITVLEELRRSVKSSGSGRALVEAAVIRLADASNFASIESLIEQMQGGGSGDSTGAAPAARRAPASGIKKNDIARPPVTPAASSGNRTATPAQSAGAPSVAARSAPSAVAPAASESTANPPTSASPSVATKPSTTQPASRPLQTPRVPSPRPAPATGGRMSQADLKVAQSEPIIRTALDVLGGRIVHVQRHDRDADTTDTAGGDNDPD